MSEEHIRDRFAMAALPVVAKLYVEDIKADDGDQYVREPERIDDDR
ncbi:MAG: hypothetical protein ING73_11270 [Rhodocyclaceae bacterium]|nr:hypothetical protein [Rhodocyclaceae bacterium]